MPAALIAAQAPTLRLMSLHLWSNCAVESIKDAIVIVVGVMKKEVIAIYLLNCVASCCKLKPTKTPQNGLFLRNLSACCKTCEIFPCVDCWILNFTPQHDYTLCIDKPKHSWKVSKFTDINISDQTLLQPAVIQTCLTSSAKAYVWPHCNMTCLTDVGMKTSDLRLTLRCSHAAPTSLRLQHCHSGIFFARMQKFRSPHLAIAKDAQHVAWFGLAHNLIIICQHLATKKKPLVLKVNSSSLQHICNNRDFMWKYRLPLEASTLSSFLYDTGSASAETSSSDSLFSELATESNQKSRRNLPLPVRPAPLRPFPNRCRSWRPPQSLSLQYHLFYGSEKFNENYH